MDFADAVGLIFVVKFRVRNEKTSGFAYIFRTKSILTRAVRPRTRPTDAAMSLLRNADLLACELLTCGALIVGIELKASHAF